MERIGIEMEFQLIDEDTYDLVDKIEPLLDRIGSDNNICHEVFQSCIEIKTDPVENVAAAKKQILEKLQKVYAEAQPLGIRLCSLSVHPFTKRTPETTKEKRYLEFANEHPYITRHHLTFSTQLHVSMSSLEQSIQVMNKLRYLLPLFTALSACCPFWQQEKTGFVSFRQYLLQAGLNGGTPPVFANKKEFEKYLETATKVGAIKGLKDIHWDIRPRPDLGTLEFRIMDAVPKIEEAMALSTLAHYTISALKVKTLKELLPSVFSEILPPSWAVQTNTFQASHSGIEAQFIINQDGDTVSLRKMAESLLEEMDIPLLKYMLTYGLPYQKINGIYHETGSYKEIIKYASNELSKEVMGHWH
ncbi:MAG TPA: YbdK family carboxylate-amine ligase [Bacteriovoracaceae bacterium]|nr:YbdK family carboxylate-amine ligase [Bacteriovoracaceae bacterium]